MRQNQWYKSHSSSFGILCLLNPITLTVRENFKLFLLCFNSNRTTELFKKSVVPKPKLAMNCVGGKNALECLRHLDKGGIMVTYGGMSREPVTVPTSAFIFKDISVHGLWMTRWSTDHAGTPEQTEMFQDISNMYAEGSLKAPVHKLVPFSNYKEGLENTMTLKGFTGLKYIFDFQTQ
jgi:trans-2-enoyl-CoA reductase